MFGQANIGGTQTQITYKDSYTKFLGIQGSARYLYRLNNRISFSAGPLLLVRQISINDLNGVTAKSGSTLNYGVIGGMGFRMGDHLEVRQSFGTLMFKAAAIWSLALGYKF